MDEKRRNRWGKRDLSGNMNTLDDFTLENEWCMIFLQTKVL